MVFLKKNLNASRPSELVVFFTLLTDRASTIPSNIRLTDDGVSTHHNPDCAFKLKSERI